MKRFILFAFVLVLGSHGKRCPSGQKLSNGRCCKLDHFYSTFHRKCRYCKCNEYGAKGGKKGRCRDNGYCYCYPHYRDGECGSCVAGYKKSNGRCCKKDAYYALWYNGCRYCRCNRYGAKGGTKGGCDEKGQCYCYDEYTNGECSSCVPGGKRLDNGRCDDLCPPGQKRSRGHCCSLDYYNYGSAKNCRYCRCDKYGAKGGVKGRCAENGDCYCYGLYTGGECQRCKSNAIKSNDRCCLKAHYFNTDTETCRACRCDRFGAKGGEKGECSYYGWCYCHPGYKGSECQHCKPGYKRSNGRCCKLDHYYATWDNKCRDCACDDNGAKGGSDGECDDKGWCYCKPGYFDAYCSQCTMSQYECCKTYQYLVNKKCYNCGCHTTGAKGGSKGKCDGNGKCYCKRSWGGPKCQY